LWMLQRARDAYVQLSATDRAAADSLLEGLGGQAFMAFEDGPRLVRDGMSVRVEAAS